MVKAMQIKVGNPLRKLVLLKLADNASDIGECWPSHQHIADQCEISKRSVINHIDALVEMGLLRVEKRIKNNEKQSNIYHLTLNGHPKAKAPKDHDEGSAGDSLPSETDAQGSAGDSLLGSAGDAHRTSHSSEPVNEPSLSSGDDKKKKSVSEKFNALAELLKLGANEQHAKDWLAIRKKKLTQTALNALVREAAKGGLSIAQAVEVCAENSWESYKSYYNLGKPMQGGSHAGSSTNHSNGTAIDQARAKSEASHQAMLNEEARGGH